MQSGFAYAFWTEWQASVFMKSRRVAGEETKDQGDEIAGLEVLVSVPGGVMRMRGLGFYSEWSN